MPNPVYCIVCSPPNPKSSVLLSPYVWSHLPSITSPFSSGNHHTFVVCVYEFLFVCLIYSFVALCFISHIWVISNGSCIFPFDLFCLAYCQCLFMLQMAVFHLFLWLSSIPLYVCTTSFLPNYPLGHLGCFQVLAITNNAALEQRGKYIFMNKFFNVFHIPFLKSQSEPLSLGKVQITLPPLIDSGFQYFSDLHFDLQSG